MTPERLYKNLSSSHPSLARNRVWCVTCGKSQAVVSAECLRYGWPKCCGQTMTIDSPQERLALNEEKKDE